MSEDGIKINAEIAPRGTAQKIYIFLTTSWTIAYFIDKHENLDQRSKSSKMHTLLEEVGPFQYRLRVTIPLNKQVVMSFSYFTAPEDGKVTIYFQ